MSFTYDLNTDIGKVRWRIGDKYVDNVIFDDEEIEVALLFEENNVKRAAAQCLETIAADQVLVLKVIKTLQLTTDGAKVAAELRANAKLLRDQAEIDAALPEDDATFDIAEQVVDVFSLREKLAKEYQRSSL